MNSRVKKQLEKTKVYIPPYKDTDDVIIIPRQTNPSDFIKVGGCYLINVANYITNPPDNFTLADNWNKGIVPECSQLRIEVLAIQGKMIQVNAFGTHPVSGKPLAYAGLWLPTKSITIVEIY